MLKNKYNKFIYLHVYMCNLFILNTKLCHITIIPDYMF